MKEFLDFAILMLMFAIVFISHLFVVGYIALAFFKKCSQ